MRDGGGGEERRWTPLKLWLEEERKSAVTKGERWEGAFAYETATWEKHRGTFDSVVFKCNIKMPQRAHAQSYPLYKVTSSCFESPSRGKSRCSAVILKPLLNEWGERHLKKQRTLHNTTLWLNSAVENCLPWLYKILSQIYVSVWGFFLLKGSPRVFAHAKSPFSSWSALIQWLHGNPNRPSILSTEHLFLFFTCH